MGSPSGNIMLRNDHDELHTVSVTIRHDAETLFQHEYPLSPSAGGVIRREGVITTTGQYTVIVILDETTREEYHWEFDENNQGVMIRVKSDETLDVGDMPRA